MSLAQIYDFNLKYYMTSILNENNDNSDNTCKEILSSNTRSKILSIPTQ